MVCGRNFGTSSSFRYTPSPGGLDFKLSGNLFDILDYMQNAKVNGKTSATWTQQDPNRQGRSQEQDEGKNEGDEKILREFDYVRAGMKGKGLVMGIATPPPNQVAIVKLNGAPYPFLPIPSVDLTLLGHVYQFGSLPDIPTDI